MAVPRRGHGLPEKHACTSTFWSCAWSTLLVTRSCLCSTINMSRFSRTTPPQWHTQTNKTAPGPGHSAWRPSISGTGVSATTLCPTQHTFWGAQNPLADALSHTWYLNHEWELHDPTLCSICCASLGTQANHKFPSTAPGGRGVETPKVLASSTPFRCSPPPSDSCVRSPETKPHSSW